MRRGIWGIHGVKVYDRCQTNVELVLSKSDKRSANAAVPTACATRRVFQLADSLGNKHWK